MTYRAAVAAATLDHLETFLYVVERADSQWNHAQDYLAAALIRGSRRICDYLLHEKKIQLPAHVEQLQRGRLFSFPHECETDYHLEYLLLRRYDPGYLFAAFGARTKAVKLAIQLGWKPTLHDMHIIAKASWNAEYEQKITLLLDAGPMPTDTGLYKIIARSGARNSFLETLIMRGLPHT